VIIAAASFLTLQTGLVAIAISTVDPVGDEPAEVALTVDGHAISRESVQRELDALNEHPAYLGLLAPSTTRAWVTEVIRGEIAQQLIDKGNLDVTESDRANARARAQEEFRGSASFAELEPWLQRRLMRRYARIAAAERIYGADDFERIVAATDIHVDSAYGRWVARNGRGALEESP